MGGVESIIIAAIVIGGVFWLCRTVAKREPKTPRFFYIAAYRKDPALKLRELMWESDLEVDSSWLDVEDYGSPKSFDSRARAAANCYAEVSRTDALVLIAEPDKGLVKGGKFVEAGVALGMNKPVYIIGDRENTLMYLDGIKQFDTMEEFVTYVAGSAEVCDG